MVKFLLALLLVGCTNTPISRGQKRYNESCAYCHGNPAIGNFGPPIKGSSRDLLSKKVILGQYPAGYKPKRNTKAMPTFLMTITPDDIDDLHEYLK